MPRLVADRVFRAGV